MEEGRGAVGLQAGWILQGLPGVQGPGRRLGRHRLSTRSATCTTTRTTGAGLAARVRRPRWKDSIASSFPHDDDAGLYLFRPYAKEYAWDWVRRFAEQNPNLLGGVTARPEDVRSHSDSTHPCSGAPTSAQQELGDHRCQLVRLGDQAEVSVGVGVQRGVG